jgi:hypothetical protein
VEWGALPLLHEETTTAERVSAMWLVIVLSVGFGILALIGLLAVAKELFCDSSLDVNLTDAAPAVGRHDIGGRASARRCVMPR